MARAALGSARGEGVGDDLDEEATGTVVQPIVMKRKDFRRDSLVNTEGVEDYHHLDQDPLKSQLMRQDYTQPESSLTGWTAKDTLRAQAIQHMP